MKSNILIIINDKSYIIPFEHFSIIQQCEILNIPIPRFCYHDQLSIAGNCRICLIEIESSLKPIIACATPISDGLKIKTISILVQKAREFILEFLLLNHPLDCPICDQGGECDLQDQALIYGRDKHRFFELKRSVLDKY
jgi:NADH dehydrogenase/NADH:ubiquinone oxidoreductase subunit G